MGDLSKNFSRHEFACRCGCGLDAIHPRLIAGLQKMRDAIGKPLVINSGCRCWTHHVYVCERANLPVTKNSQHLPKSGCRAADVALPKGVSISKFYDYAEDVPEFTGIIKYPWGLHVDCREGLEYRGNQCDKRSKK